MATKGRRSKADLTTPSGKKPSAKRPTPPKSFNSEQKAEWESLVNSKPPSFFPTEKLPLLEMYIRALSEQRKLAKTLEKLDPIKQKADYKSVASCKQQEDRVITNLTIKLSIAQSASYAQKRTRAAEVAEGAPWQWDLDDE